MNKTIYTEYLLNQEDIKFMLQNGISQVVITIKTIENYFVDSMKVHLYTEKKAFYSN